MKTRNNGVYLPGYYKLLNSPLINLKKSTIYNYRLPNDFCKFTNKVNEEILKKLCYHPKISPICVCRISISTSIFKYLKQKFNITGRFRNNSTFIESFSVKHRRYFAINKYCDFDTSTFQIKISKRRAFNYYEEGMINTQIPQTSIFTCRYIRRNNVVRENK